MRTVDIRERMKSYGNTDLIHLAPTLSPFPFAFCKKSVSPSSFDPTILLFYFSSSDVVAHPFPITLGCCLGPQHDPLYISTLLRLSFFASVSLCCVCTFVHVREIENYSDHISVTVIYSFCWNPGIVRVLTYGIFKSGAVHKERRGKVLEDSLCVSKWDFVGLTVQLFGYLGLSEECLWVSAHSNLAFMGCLVHIVCLWNFFPTLSSLPIIT